MTPAQTLQALLVACRRGCVEASLRRLGSTRVTVVVKMMWSRVEVSVSQSGRGKEPGGRRGKKGSRGDVVSWRDTRQINASLSNEETKVPAA